MEPFRVTIFTKPGCTLCDKAKALVEKVGLIYPLVVEEFDIESDENIHAAYWDKIPVLHIDGEEAFVSKVAEHWLRRYFSEKLEALAKEESF